MSDLSFRGLAQATALGSVHRIFETLNFDNCRAAGAWLGLFAFGALGTRRRLGIANIRLALGVSEARANQILRRSCVNYGMTFAEFMHQRVATREEIHNYVQIDNMEMIDACYGEGHGAILLTAHIGNWELLGARVAQAHRLCVVARPMNNKRTQDFFDQPRLKQGLEVTSKYDDMRALVRILRTNAALALLPDQYAGRKGQMLPMFGQPTKFWDSIPRLAMLTGSPILPGFGIRKQAFLSNGSIHAKVSPAWKVDREGDREANVLEATKRIIWETENIIRAYPEQWLWLQRRWRASDGAAISL